MGDSPDNRPGRAEKAEAEPGATPPGHTANLPVVAAPPIGPGEGGAPELIHVFPDIPNCGCDEGDAAADAAATDDGPRAATHDEPAASPQARMSRFALLAATVALAAACGALFGSLSAFGVARLIPAAEAKIGSSDVSGAARALKLELAELAAVKASLDTTSRNANAQLAKIADRLDRIEHAQAEPTGKLAHIADMLDRLGKRSAGNPDITGSIAPAPPSAAEPKPPVIDGWIVRDVQDGRALVESRFGGVFDVGSGSTLPGLGRVESIKRQNGQWVVLTAHGMIVSAR